MFMLDICIQYFIPILLPDSGLAIILLIVVSLLAMLLSLLTLIDHQTCPVLFQNNSVRTVYTFL